MIPAWSSCNGLLLACSMMLLLREKIHFSRLFRFPEPPLSAALQLMSSMRSFNASPRRQIQTPFDFIELAKGETADCASLQGAACTLQGTRAL